MSNHNLRSVIQSFHYDESEPAKVTKITKKIVSPKSKKITSKPTTSTALKDLPPMISDDLTLLFVGFNPGVESSKQQHHYAHPTNLFWKLFNALNLLLKVLNYRNIEIKSNAFLAENIYRDGAQAASARHDHDLVQFGVGFTDLVLRCTKTAQELSKQEKLDNVPRLFTEFENTNTRWVVIIGKGIWEVIVRYVDPKLRLTKENFQWGLQTGKVVTYIHQQCKNKPQVYVFPNTSGLVALMKYSDKLALWDTLAGSIQ